MGNYIPQREWDAINRKEFSPTDLRLSELGREYFFATGQAVYWQRVFTETGDTECAAIAAVWAKAFADRYRRVRRSEKALEDRKRAARIARRHGRSI